MRARPGTVNWANIWSVAARSGMPSSLSRITMLTKYSAFPRPCKATSGSASDGWGISA